MNKKITKGIPRTKTNCDNQAGIYYSAEKIVGSARTTMRRVRSDLTELRRLQRDRAVLRRYICIGLSEN